MKKEYPRLETFQLVRPCPINMDGLDPTEKENFCKSCNKKVYNLSVLSSDAAEALLEEKGNKACVMFVRNNDGRIATDNCPTFLRPIRRCARIAISLVSVVFLWFLVQGKAMAQKLVGQPIDPKWGCSINPNWLSAKTPIEQLQSIIPMDERGLCTSALSFLVAWCTWLALIAKAKNTGSQQKHTVSKSIGFFIAMLIVIFAPTLLNDSCVKPYDIDATTKMVLMAAGPIMALLFWLYTSTLSRPKSVGIETVALLIAIPMTLATMSHLQTFTLESSARIVQETYFTFAFVGMASVLDSLLYRKKTLSRLRILALLISPPLLAFTWEMVILEPGWLVLAVVSLACIAVLFQQRIFATVAAALFAFPFLRLVVGFLYGGLSSQGLLTDFGYDTARDLVRCGTALALAFAFTVIWWHEIKHTKLSPQTIIVLMSIPILVHLIGTFSINNFGGLGGGL